MSPLGSGALVGLIGGAGVVWAASAAPPLRRPSLDDRLAPYLRDSPRPSRLLDLTPTMTPFPVLERVLRPAVAEITALLERHVGGTTGIRRRLTALGRGQSVPEFRVEQVVWAAVGLLGAMLLTAAAAATGRANPISVVMLALAGIVGGVLGRDYWLTAQVRRRQALIVAEFPTVAELLALAVAAGEGPLGAIERVCRLGSGELVRELAVVLAQARAGTPLVLALTAMRERTEIDALARFVDGMVVAVERGTPLADVLRAQAVDAREAGKRALLEAGGRREIAMMMPVVFLVLPVTVAFALYPGLFSLVTLAR
jgi:tight adherence protein C